MSAAAALALEIVSQDKPERDLIDRRDDYVEARLAGNCTVSLQSETIVVLRLQEGIYEEVGDDRGGQSAVSVLMPRFSVAIDDVFNAD
jgi:Uma2 family endonuclease